MHSVNTENWSFCRYEKENFLAQITFGADPESLSEDRLEFYVTVLLDEQTEIFQKKFMNLTEACLYLNSNYRDWNFLDQTATKSGCSTCAAH
jgi:hypothetical protein